MTAGRQRLGAHGEDRVARWYAERGWRLLDRNWRGPGGEIDLVVTDGRTVVFCEVKTRSGTGFGSPAEAVTPAKQGRVRRTAAAWLAAHDHHGEVRFDVGAVLGAQIEVIEGAF